MGDAYSITPVEVPRVETKHRRIASPIPHPESVPLLERLREIEPLCMEGQPPIVWDRAEMASVFDAWGNRWIDLSSGVLITNAGHGRQPMVEAMVSQARKPLLTTYCFPHRIRAELVELLRQQAPRPDDKVMLLSTGSEADELCLKLAREHGRRAGKKNPVLVSFHNAFHGRTLGSQLAGGIPGLKEWIGYPDEHFIQVPFPDGGVRCAPEDNEFPAFLRSLERQGIAPGRVCGVLTETYQGGNSSFAPAEYMQALRQWCDRHDALLIMDEVQAGFGRTGRFWGFEHYGIVPDLIACGKGITGSLPLSAVIGRREIMDQFPPGSMTSTHSGNPICCAVALANLKIILGEELAKRAAATGPVMQSMAAQIQRRFRDRIVAHHGRGLVASLHCVQAGGKQPDARLAWEVVGRAVQSGVMLFAPVGYGGASVKLSPPLVIEEDALREAMAVIEECFAAALRRC
ncbi:MAG: aspartate aminotransferase family protein [Verrucomicrobia bacterium]|jgi:4-aminobutyrate aminotransferase/diaminobutyrate-pyruvate transaminase/4-aminobutyrate aminotransferase/(S)-3-amino-2-methylpropionate transaminase|nr:aspartate aminotransferase family protein [Verrucomicrobiota bacterium]